MEQQVIVVATDWALFGATLFLGFVALLVALIGPYIGDIFKRRFIAPRLHIEFRNESPYCHLTKLKSPDNEYYTYYFCFAVENRGKSAARSCEVVLEEVCTADDKNEFHPVKQFWPTNLMLQGNEPVHINPGRPPIYVAIGHISEPMCQKNCEPPYSIVTDRSDLHRFIFDFPIGQRLFFKIDSRSSGRHIFKVVIIGENFKPIKKQFELCWSGNWTEDEAQMLQKEAVLIMKEEEEPGYVLKEKTKNEGTLEKSSQGTGTQNKSSNLLELGLVFLSFSLVLFGLASPNGRTEVIAVIVFIVSVLFMLRIIVVPISHYRLPFVSKVAHHVRLGDIIGTLWPLVMLVYLFNLVFPLGNGTSEMQTWSRFGSSVVTVVGLIWAYIIIAVFLAKKVFTSEHKGMIRIRKHSMLTIGVVVISLGFVISGIIVACTHKPSIDWTDYLLYMATGLTFLVAYQYKNELSSFAPF